MASGADSELSASILAVLERQNPLLFAGAGVGFRVGFPTWDQYIEHLAGTCDRFGDAESAVLMRKRLEQRNHLGAATVFKTSTLVPEGERWRALSDPFRTTVSDAELDKLLALVSLPFTAVVTTNYEHSLHDAAARARRRWVAPIERNTLRGASLNRDFFVARIHGNAEQPTSMAVDLSDYGELRRDPNYLDFLLHVFTSRSCLFLGFSFLDPAIIQVLDIYAERFGPAYPSLHTAIVSGGDAAFEHRLRQLNIEVIKYDAAGGHGILWRAIRDASARAAEIPPLAPPDTFDSRVEVAVDHGSIHRFVAFTYAQARLRKGAQPVVAIAQDGIVASVVSSRPEGVISEEELVSQVAGILRLSPGEASGVVAASLGRLAARDVLLRDGAVVMWAGSTESDLDKQLTRLADDVLDRAYVREGLAPKDKDRLVVRVLIEKVLMARAWDIGAHYAGNSSGWAADVRGFVRKLVLDMPQSERPSSPTTIERALHDLFKAPDANEAEVLTSLGRAAFGIQLLLSSPRQTLFHEQALPETLYLDASVLMPAITTGHPLRPAYIDVIEKLRQAAEKVGGHLSLAVGLQFLNEIVSHRKLAIDMVRAAGLDDPENLRRHIQFHSAENTNVFVGAYGSVVGRMAHQMPFAEFLAQAAPFETEQALASHLERLGIRAVPMDFAEEHNLEFIGIFNPLAQVYEEDQSRRVKARVLVRHEAQQLTQLVIDAKRGGRSLFVTADRQLRRALTGHVALRRLSGMTVSHLGLVALADVMVGLDTDARSLARLVWAAPAGDQEKTLFDYFVTLGLREYQEGLATELQVLAEKSAREASDSADEERVDLFGNGADEVARRAAFLDRFEDRFYEHWREAIRRKERESE